MRMPLSNKQAVAKRLGAKCTMYDVQGPRLSLLGQVVSVYHCIPSCPRYVNGAPS